MNYLTKRRKELGLTQQQLADAMGVDQAAVSRWEKGTAGPRWNRVPQLAEVLHCTIDQLYGREPPEGGGMEQAGA